MSMQLQLWSPAHLCQRRSCSRGTLRLAGEPSRSGDPRLQFRELCIPRLAACVGLVNWLVGSTSEFRWTGHQRPIQSTIQRSLN